MLCPARVAGLWRYLALLRQTDCLYPVLHTVILDTRLLPLALKRDRAPDNHCEREDPMTTSQQSSKTPTLTLHIGHEELIIRQRYEVLSIVNDLLIGTWFIIGSILFFYESLAYIGTWLFLIGSIEMMIRPLIRLARRVHIQRLHPEAPAAVDAGHDY